MENTDKRPPPRGSVIVPRLEWLSAIARDTSLPCMAARLAIIMIAYINGKTGIAWPSQDTLAKHTGASVDTVRRSLNALVNAGHLVRLAAGGPGRSAQYRLAIEASGPSKSATKQNGHPCKTAAGILAKLPLASLQDCHPNSLDTNSNEENSSISSEDEKSEVARRDNLFEEQPKTKIVQGEVIASDRVEKTERAAPTRGPANHDGEGDAFEQFWKAYPRREAKGTAAKAFRSAIKAGADPGAIISGARRYADQRTVAEPDPVTRQRFTKMPATWLRATCWEDEAPAPAGGVLIDGLTGEAIIEPARPTAKPVAFDPFAFGAQYAETMGA